MERQGCRFGSGTGAGGFLISLEDLDSVTEDESLDLAGAGNDNEDRNAEVGNEQVQDGLLAYWQNIGRRHQVDVTEDMAEPIQQMARHNQSQDREMVPFTPIGHKMADELLYEKRQYEKAKWACVTQNEPSYEQSTGLGFMKLMKYICQQNSSGLFLGMTLPIVTIVHTNQTRTELRPEITMAYYLPTQFQDQTPQPLDAEIAIEEWPAHIIYTRSFNGNTTEELILQEINQLAEHLDSTEWFLQDTFIVAGYNNPAAPSRHNEIWFIHSP
ncbi:heme-binding protein soul3 [Mustelus asterias]